MSALASGSWSPTRRSSSTSPGRMGSGLPGHVEEADLISYGLGGLISAIERFDLVAGDQVRDLRDHADPRRDHRRAAQPRLGAALGARSRPGDRARQHEARGPAPARAHRRGDGERAGAQRRRVPGERCSRSPTRRSSRSTSCGTSRTPPATRSRCSTRSPDRDAPTRSRSSTSPSCATGSPTRSPRCPSARSSWSPSTTTRT